MKRFFAMLLVLGVLLANLPGALAEDADATLDLTALRAYETVNQLCWIGEILYILGDEGIYTWRQGEGAALLLDMKASAPLRYIDQPPADETQKNEWERTIHFIFTDGAALYAIHQYSGKMYKLDGQQLTLWHTLPIDRLWVTIDGAPMFRGIRDIEWAHGMLYLLLGSDDTAQWDKTELFAFDSQSEQMVKRAPEHVEQIAAGPGGKLLLMQRTISDEGNDLQEVFEYDPATDTLEKAPILTSPGQITGGVQWYDDALIFCQDQAVTRLCAGGPAEEKTTLPVAMTGLATKSRVSDHGTYAAASGRYVFLRDIAAGGSQQTALRVVGDISPDTMIQFSIDNPDIAVLAVSIEGMDGLQQALLTAGADADVFVVAAPGAYAGVRDKGFAASLNDSAALMTKARQLHPAVQEALFAGDQLLAYPVAVQAYSWTVNQTLWERFALGEYPRTYAELFAGLARWEDEHAQDNPEYRFIDMQENLAGYVAALVREYILQNERADAPLSFDTPAFREALGCIIENRYLIEDVAEQSGMPLLFSYSMGYGVGSNDGEKTVMLLPPTLSGDDQQALCVNLEVLALNPASQHKAEAIRFIEYAAERMDISMQYMIDPSLNTPVRPEGYETRAAQLAEEIAEMEDQAKTAEDSETSGLEDALANKRAVLEAMEREQWLISQESIDNYQELAEHLRAPYATLFLTNEPNSGWETLAPIIQRYCDQGLDEGAIGAFVQELDRVAGMIFAERM